MEGGAKADTSGLLKNKIKKQVDKQRALKAMSKLIAEKTGDKDAMIMANNSKKISKEELFNL